MDRDDDRMNTKMPESSYITLIILGWGTEMIVQLQVGYIYIS